MAEATLVQAVNRALARALAEDERVLVYGEDVGANGGVFRATEGLQTRFGAKRVFDTPLAEVLIAGLAVGLAAEGMRPVAEIQFSGFIYATLDQIANHAGRLRNRTRGRLSCPLVLRAPWGGGVHAPEHHSECPEALFVHLPGIRVVIPSSPRRAYGLLLAAIRDPDPVVFFEPTRLYRSTREDVPDDGQALPLDRCFTLRAGSDVTLATWGASVVEATAAAQTVAAEGIEVEVIDIATLAPFDAATILDSVAKTGRLVIAHEAPMTGGFGAEVAARVAAAGLFSLKAPIARVTGYDTVVPYPKLEWQYLPTAERIAAALRATAAVG